LTVTWETLRELAGFRAKTSSALSLYLDLDPSTAPTPARAEMRLRSLLARAEKELGSNGGRGHEERLAVGRDLDRIRSWWVGEFERDGAHGLALFTSSADGLWRVLALTAPVPDTVHIGRQLALAPLVGLAADDKGALVVVVDRERGRVFRVHDGRLEEVVDRSEEQPRRHDQGGWSQANFQRHLDKLVADHVKAVGDEIDERVRRSRGPQLVVVTRGPMRHEIESALSPQAREAIVGWANADAHASPGELLEVARPHLERARGDREREAVERWRDELGRGGRACAGWAETLAAASTGRVEQLFLAGRATREAFDCPACGRAEAAPGRCPLDGAELAAGDGAELAVRHTLAHGGAVVRVAPGELADDVAALLRF